MIRSFIRFPNPDILIILLIIRVADPDIPSTCQMIRVYFDPDFFPVDMSP